MEKNDFTKQFAIRLRNTLIEAGFNSPRSVSGVDIDKLAEITCYSPQICRKYLRGEAIPEPVKLIELATKLHVSPGWLLFGDGQSTIHLSNQHLTISKNLLHYIFTEARELYSAIGSGDEVADFLQELASDVSQINATEAQSKKIIDLALSSARHFRASQSAL